MKKETRKARPSVQLQRPFRFRHTTLFALLAGSLAAHAHAQGLLRFDSLDRDPATLTTGTTLPAGKPAVFDSATPAGNYAGNAQVAAITLEAGQAGAPADGKTASTLTVKVMDAQGRPLAGEVIVTIETTGGRLVLPGQDPLLQDADALIPGHQLVIKGGTARIELLAPFEPQDVRIRVTAGAQQASTVISFLPELREWLAAGVIDGVVSLRNLRPGALLQARQEDGFEREMRFWQDSFNEGKGTAGMRASFFIKGKIKGEYLLTAAFDSDKETRRRLAQTVRPEEFYPVYGDGAVRGTEAQSSEKLFVRVDHGKSFFLFGDYRTAVESPSLLSGTPAGLRLRDLGAYNREVTGGKWHGESDSHAFNLFASRDNLKQVIDEFPGLGVSGPYALSNTGALLGTERVEIIVRDRNHRGMVLSSTPLSPVTDYTFEPFSGRLLLKQPVPSLDSRLNPVSIRVTYEMEQGGPGFWLKGMDGQVKVTDNVEVGGSLVRDDNPLAVYRVGSANLGFKLGPRTMLAAEVAATHSDVNNSPSSLYGSPSLAGRSGELSGRAARVELRHEADNWSARAFAGRSEPEFNNPAASLDGGRGEAGARVDYQLTPSTRLYGQLLRNEDVVSGGERHAADIGFAHQFNEVIELDAGLRSVRESGTSSALSPMLGGSVGPGIGGGFYGIGNSSVASPNGTGFIYNGGYATTGATATPVDADTAHVGLRWKLSPRWKMAAEAEADVTGQNKSRFAMGAEYQLSERSQVYARVENQQALASVFSANPADRSRAFAIGVSSSFLTNSQVYSEYRLRDAIDSTTASLHDVQLATGIQNMVNARPGLRYTTGAEHLRVASGGGREGFALTGSVEYTASELWKGSTRLEYRRVGNDPATRARDSQDSILSTISLARKLDRDWTALARNYALSSDDRSLPGRHVQDRFQVGAAYRPVDHNRFDALMKVEYKLDRNEESPVGIEVLRATVASAHLNYHPSRPVWLAGRVAAKWTQDRDGNYKAYLASGRATWDFSEKWDVSFLTSLKLTPSGSARQWAQGLELGYALQKNLWVSAGANWMGFADKDLAGSDYTDRGAYVRLRFKFDENVFAARTTAQ